jgi:hypothetical protein
MELTFFLGLTYVVLIGIITYNWINDEKRNNL